MFATRPMNVTALGPAIRSLILMSAYSKSGMHGQYTTYQSDHGFVPGCQNSAGLGLRASCSSSAVNPSPIGVSIAWGFIGEIAGVIYDCTEAFWLFCRPVLIEMWTYEGGLRDLGGGGGRRRI
jgi:hypothetical protein